MTYAQRIEYHNHSKLLILMTYHRPFVYRVTYPVLHTMLVNKRSPEHNFFSRFQIFMKMIEY